MIKLVTFIQQAVRVRKKRSKTISLGGKGSEARKKCKTMQFNALSHWIMIHNEFQKRPDKLLGQWICSSELQEGVSSRNSPGERKEGNLSVPLSPISPINVHLMEN